jgi:hypothetical protein
MKGIEGIELYGMGVAETFVDKKIANRMKKRGMYWTREGAHAMAAILMLKSNRELSIGLNKLHYSIENPVKELRNYIRKTQRDWSDWLRTSLPVTIGRDSGKMWVKVLKQLSRPVFEFV